MRLYTEPRPRGTVPVGALLMTPLFGLPFGAWLLEQGYIEFGTCGLQMAFDMPCLSCGATRATLALFGGDIASAFALQPLIISVYFLLVIWGVASLYTFARDRKLVLDLTKTQDIAFKVSLVVLPLVNWAYLIWQDV